MPQSCYAYRINIANSFTAQIESRDPEGNVLGEPQGNLGYKGKAQARISELAQAARDGKLTGEQLEELGEKLFRVVFDEKLSQHFFALFEKVRDEEALLRLELDVDERQLPDLAALPWEFMRVPSDAGYGAVWLGTAPLLVFARRRARWIAAKQIQLAEGERLRIALLVAAPEGEDVGPIKYEEVWGALQALAAQQPDRIELLDLVNPATPKAIDDVLKKKPHIFHFTGHGRLKDEAQAETGEVALVDVVGGPQWVDAETFASLFGRYRPGIVLLDACEGAAFSSSRAFVGVASQVMEQNIPVVVAMQYEVSNSTAKQFALKFYDLLAQGNAVDQAVQEGRLEIALSKGYTKRDFATPVLFMRVQNGQLFIRLFPIPDRREVLQKQYADLSAQSLAEERAAMQTPPGIEKTLLEKRAQATRREMEQIKRDLTKLGVSVPPDPATKPAPAQPADGVDRVNLRQILNQYFSEGELKTLCFDLGVSYEDLPGDAKPEKIVALIGYFDRRLRDIGELVDKIRLERPKVKLNK